MFYLPIPYTQGMNNPMKSIVLPAPNPGCDICKQRGHDPVPDAIADVPTTLGPWGYVCKSCFKLFRAGTRGTMIVWE